MFMALPQPNTGTSSKSPTVYSPHITPSSISNLTPTPSSVIRSTYVSPSVLYSVRFDPAGIVFSVQ